ncbi:MAG: gluconolaconase, partial [Acidobacteriaceae bacterium]|nr:gluconolaconase [Acidobacteriaceae bacterium]
MASKQQMNQQSLRPTIGTLEPPAAITGGELHIRGEHLAAGGHPTVRLGNQPAQLVVAGDSYIIARVPESAIVGELIVASGTLESELHETHIGIKIADSLHPVANPVVDSEGNIFSTFSGSRGQKSPVSIYKVDTNYNAKPFVTDLMNPTGLAFDREGLLYVSSRYDGIVYQVTRSGNMSVYVEGMGVATGLAFDPEENLYVGDRSGTIFKISRSRQIYVFATLEPSIAAYHLAFGPDDSLYVTGPTTSSFDSIFHISKAGEVETFYRGLGRPQGIAFDAQGRLYVAASLRGRRGIIRIDQSRKPEQFLSGPGVVGLAFTPSRAVV